MLRRCTTAFFVVSLFDACQPTTPTGRLLDGPECEIVSTLSPEDAGWTGPTEADVLAQLDAFVPRSVTWQHTLNGREAALDVSWTPTASPPRVVEREGDWGCRPGPELEVELSLDVVIDGGEVTSTLEGWVSAPVDGSTVWVDADGDALLSPAWDDLGQNSESMQHFDEPAGWRMYVWEEWTLGEMAIRGEGDDHWFVAWTGMWDDDEP